MHKPLFCTLSVGNITLHFLVGQFQSVKKYLSSNPPHPEVILPTSLNDLAIISNSSSYDELYKKVDICTTDGMPLVWWFRWKLGNRVDRLYGPDIMRDLIEEIHEKQLIVCPSQEVADLLKIRYEDPIKRAKIVIEVVGRVTDKLEQARLLNLINKEKPVVVWIGVGSPNQIHLATLLKKSSKTKTRYFCVGAAVPFLAGKVSQAPQWMQRSGLEWLFRLIQEPKRLWRRYLIDIPLFVLKLFWARFR